MARDDSAPVRGRRFGRTAWVEAAREALIEDGLAGLYVERLAQRLGATRAAFYYHFGSRAELLEDLVEHWKTTNTRCFEEVLAHREGGPEDRLRELVHIWINERGFDPRFDSAMRAWAHESPAISQVIRQIDQRRIDLLKKVFVELGYPDLEAFIRARITYFHQVGYYALEVQESRKRRLELAPVYIAALAGTSDLSRSR